MTLLSSPFLVLLKADSMEISSPTAKEAPPNMASAWTFQLVTVMYVQVFLMILELSWHVP